MNTKINLSNRKNSLALTWQFNHKYLLRIWQNAVTLKDFGIIKNVSDMIFQYSEDQLNELYLDFKNDISY